LWTRDRPDRRQAVTVTRPDQDTWVVIAEAHSHVAAREAAIERLAELGIMVDSAAQGFGSAGLGDDDVRLDMICGREPDDTTTRVSVRKAALEDTQSRTPGE
jgi:hypothetical protein